MNENINVIKKTLLKVGISPDLVGYHYLTSAICVVLEERLAGKIKCGNTTKMYKDIAKEFDATEYWIERAMRYAIGKAFSSKNELLYEIFGTLIDGYTGKVTNSCFVYTLTEYLIIEGKVN